MNEGWPAESVYSTGMEQRPPVSDDEIIDFYNTHGFLPRRDYPGRKKPASGILPPVSAEEDRLGRRVVTLRQRARYGHAVELESRFGDFFTDGTLSPFAAKAQRWASWTRIHGRQPSRHAWLDDEERRLGQWMHNTRYAASQGHLSDTRTSLLNARCPGWRQSERVSQQGVKPSGRRVPAHAFVPSDAQLSAFTAQADHWDEWTRAHGHRPRSDTADAVERKLGAWLGYVRWYARHCGLPQVYCAVLDARRIDWPTAGHRQSIRAEEVREFRDAHGGRWPSRAAGASAEEVSLCRYLEVRRAKAERGTLDPEERAALDDAAPGWDAPRTPAPSASEPSVRKASVRTWQDRRWRTPSDTPSLEQAASFDEATDGTWRVSHGESIWRQARAIQDFVAAEGRWPRVRAGASRQETRSARFLDAQRVKSAAETFLPGQRDILDSVIPGWEDPGSAPQDVDRDAASAALLTTLRSLGDPFVR